MNRNYTYKDSGIKWIGKIPSHWQKRKFKWDTFYQEGPGLRAFQFKREGIRVICVSNITEKGIDFRTTHTRYISLEEYKEKYQHFTVADGDILLSSSGSIGKVSRYFFDQDPVILNTSTIRIHSLNKDKYFDDFIPYVLKSSYIQTQLKFLMTGGIVSNFGPSHLDQLFNFIPPLSEQKEIVSFLDKKTSLVTSLIEKTEQKIELLKNQRTSLINHYITKGLNSNIEIKKSGVKWIGKVPSHWKVIPIKYILKKGKDSIRTGPFGSSLKSDEFLSEGVRVYNQRSVYDEDFSKSNIFVSSKKYEELKSFEVLPKDVLITSRGTIGRMTIVPENGEIGILHPCLIRLRLNRAIILDEFLRTYINLSSLFLESVLFESNSTTIEVIYSGTLANVKIPLPPYSEQQQILSFLKERTEFVNKKISIEEKRIKLLKEYLQSLVSSVVTGKINVSEVVK